MFTKKSDRLATLEVVVDALISLLHSKDLIKRDEIQLEILAKAEEEDE